MGADEVNAKMYELDSGVESSDPDVIRPGLQNLVNIVMDAVERAGLVPIAWEELLLDWNIELPKSTIIQVWRSHESLVKVAQRGHRAIFGLSNLWYLDGGHGGWVDPDPNNHDHQSNHLFSIGTAFIRPGSKYARTTHSKVFLLSFATCFMVAK